MGECLVPDAVEDVDALLDLLEDAVDLALQLPAGAHGCPAGGGCRLGFTIWGRRRS